MLGSIVGFGIVLHLVIVDVKIPRVMTIFTVDFFRKYFMLLAFKLVILGIGSNHGDWKFEEMC